jgi:hypothetical protein
MVTTAAPAAGSHFARTRGNKNSLRGCVEGDQVMGILELFVVAFLIGTPAIMLADGLTG